MVALCKAPAVFAAAIALAVVVGPPVIAQKFTAPARLNQGDGAGWASAGIDAVGTATAVWAGGGGITFSSHPLNGAWTTPASFPAGTTINPSLRVAASGAATVVTYDAANIWVADKAVGGGWGAPTPILTGVPLGNPFSPGVKPVQFLENTAGDAAIVYRGGAGFPFIGVFRRTAGGQWTAQQSVPVPQSNYITLSSAAIGEAGDVIVTWGNHEVSCTFRGCHDINFAIYAATSHAPGVAFVTSPALLAYPDSIVRSAIDPKGRAVVLAQYAGSQVIDALVQPKPGGAWSASAAAYMSATYHPQLAAAAAGAKGRATAILFNPDNATGNVSFVDGNLSTNAWTPPSNLSFADATPPVIAPQAAANAPGGAVAAWLDTDGTIRAATRKSAGAPWQTAQTLTTPDAGATAACAAKFGLVWTCNVILGTAINTDGHGVVLYQQLQADGSSPLFAATN